MVRIRTLLDVQESEKLHQQLRAVPEPTEIMNLLEALCQRSWNNRRVRVKTTRHNGHNLMTISIHNDGMTGLVLVHLLLAIKLTMTFAPWSHDKFRLRTLEV